MSADSPGDEDISSPGKFCRKCWAPKPERVRRPMSWGVLYPTDRIRLITVEAVVDAY